MYAMNVDKGRISLGRVIDGLQGAVLAEEHLSVKKVFEQIVFMEIYAETCEGRAPAAAVMKGSYASYLASGFETTVLNRYCGIRNRDARSIIRGFNCMFGSSDVRSANRMHIPQYIREHAGIPLYGRVFVAERNGYALISTEEAVAAGVEKEPWNAKATTIDKVVSAIARRDVLEAVEDASKILKV